MTLRIGNYSETGPKSKRNVPKPNPHSISVFHRRKSTSRIPLSDYYLAIGKLTLSLILSRNITNTAPTCRTLLYTTSLLFQIILIGPWANVAIFNSKST